jgi:long-subunit acyl-CoA synthetase (AMP-forming)
VRQATLPWARPGSGFSHLFEAFLMTLAAEMPVRAIADLVGEHDTRAWRVVHHHIERARAIEDFSSVRHLGGSAAPEALIRAFDQFGLRVLHGWGMTEMSPLGTVSRVKRHLRGDAEVEYRLINGVDEDGGD